MNLTTVFSFPKTHRVDGPSNVNTVQLSALETSCTPAVSNTVKTTLRYSIFRNVHVGFIKAWETKLYFNNKALNYASCLMRAPTSGAQVSTGFSE
jgi:hypothetical protein